jgi:hypothetical protein
MKTEYKTGDAVGRPSCGSTSLGHPDAKFSMKNGEQTQTRANGQKKKESMRSEEP